MNPEFLVDGVLRSVLGGRRKRSRRAARYLTRGVGGVAGGAARLAGAVNRGSGGFLSRPSTLLGAVGLAWGIFETLQHREAQPQAGAAVGAAAAGTAPGPPVASAGTTSAGTVAVPPLPNVSAPPEVSPDAMRLVRLAVSAAHADGVLNDHERAAILQQAREAGVESVLAPEIERPRPLAEVVAGVSDPAERATLYVLAYTILRSDEQVTGAERIYLAQLANLLGLDADTVAKLETDTGQRIDALGDQGQPGG